MLRVESIECQGAVGAAKDQKDLSLRRLPPEGLRSSRGARSGCGIGSVGAGFSVDLGRASFHRIPQTFLPVPYARANECGEKRVWRERLGLEFGMELAADEPRMIRNLDNFHVDAIGRASSDAEPGVGQSFLVIAIEFVAMAMALGNFSRAVSLRGE